MLEFIDNHLILYKKATSVSVDQKCICELALTSDFPRSRKGLFILVLACFLGEELIIVSAKIHVQHLEGLH